MHSVSVVIVVVQLILILWIIHPEVRYVVRRYRSKNWPATTGTIDGGIDLRVIVGELEPWS